MSEATGAFPPPRWDQDDSTKTKPDANGGPQPRRAAEVSAEGLLHSLTSGEERKVRPQEGMRSAIFDLTGGRVNLGLSTAEQHRRDLSARIAADPGAGLWIVMVWAQKGGVGKTTTAAMLGNALSGNATYPVAVIDVNPDGGSLGVRVPRTTTKTTLDLRDALRSDPNLPPHELSGYVNKSEHRLDAIVMPPGRKPANPLTGSDFEAIVEYLRRYGHYKVLIVDCGTDPSGPVMDGVLAEADQLVVVATTIKDESTVTAGGLEVLVREGMSDLVENSIVAMVEKSPRDPDVTVQAEITRTADQVKRYFASVSKEVVTLPYDSRIRIGNVLDPAAISPESRESHLELAAAVVDRLREESLKPRG